MRILKRKASLQFRIIGLVIVVIFSILLFVGYFFNLIISKLVEDTVGRSAMDVAKLVAELPDVRNALLMPNASEYLQPRTRELIAKTQAGFITIFDTNGNRFTHNNPDNIGKKFTGGDEGPALMGKEYVSKAEGISGPSIRAFVPIKHNDQVIGVVCVGMFYNAIYRIVHSYFTSISASLVFGLIIGILLSVVLAKNVKKILHGLEPDEIANIVKEREALLNCLHEGVIAVDKHGKISLINESAHRILSIGKDAIGKPIAQTIPLTRMNEIMEKKTNDYNSEIAVNNVTIIVNRAPIIVNNEVTGAVSTFRDITEMRSLAEELTGVKQYTEGLRAKTHEFMNQLQIVNGLLELQEYDEAKSFIMQTTKCQQKLLQFLTRKIQDPKISALLIGKIQQADERNIKLTIDPGSFISHLPAEISRSMVLILGNLIDNSIDAVEGYPDGTVEVTLLEHQQQWTVMVEDNGQGIPAEQVGFIFNKHYSTKNTGRGYGLYFVRNHLDHVLHGQIQVTSAPGQGTAFLVTIPKAGLQPETTGLLANN